MAALRGLRRMLCVLPLSVLAACNGVGKGDKVDHLQMFTQVGQNVELLAANSDLPSFQCLRQQLGIYAVFGRNGIADYTFRPATIWTSNRPEIVSVSNGNEPDPAHPDRVFPKGVITPHAEGSAIITANYVGIETRISVTVTEPDSIILSTSPYDTTADASKAGTLSIATGSSQQYFAYAKLKDKHGVTSYQNVTGNAVWSIVGDFNGDYATVTNPVVGTTLGGGLVVGNTPSGALTVNANFPACPNSQFVDVMSQVQVVPVQSLMVQHDPNFLAITNPGFVFTLPPAAPSIPPNPPNPLVLNTSEAFVVTARLTNGDYQDLSQQSVLTTETSTSGVLAFASNIGKAVAVGSTKVTASFTGRGITTLSPPLVVQTQSATMSNYVIALDDQNQSIPIQGFHQYRAQARFLPDVAPGMPQTPFIQDLTQNTNWRSSSPSDVTIGDIGTGVLVGVAVSQRSVETCLNISGTFVGDPTGDTNYLTSLGVGVGVTPTGCSAP